MMLPTGVYCEPSVEIYVHQLLNDVKPFVLSGFAWPCEKRRTLADRAHFVPCAAMVRMLQYLLGEPITVKDQSHS
jgi:hypothetical protein